MTYKEILTDYSEAFYENDRFYRFKDEALASRFYSNYIDYKKMPSLELLQEDLATIKEEQKDYPLDFAMVFFPEDAAMNGDIKGFLEASKFVIEKHIIFTCPLENLKLSQKDIGDIRIEKLTPAYFKDYLDYKYQQRLEYGQVFAKQMYDWDQEHLPEEGSQIYLAIDGEKLVGDVTVWEYGDYIEIDDFSLLEDYRGRGIGSALQREASRDFQSAILISEEVNRDMYQHQGYQEAAYYWTALRHDKPSDVQ